MSGTFDKIQSRPDFRRHGICSDAMRVGMQIALPDDDTLYRALLDRDPSFDGRAFVGVASTGVFCRLTCPARKPRRENCSFFETPVACVEAGFRPCKRCHPLGAEPVVIDLLAALEAEPDLRWSEGELLKRGYEPSRVRKAFRRTLGTTFLNLARQKRINRGLSALKTSVTSAQLDAGFDSPSAFRAAFARLLGCAPSALKGEGRLMAQYIPTKLGDMIAVASQTHLHLLEFTERKILKSELAHLMKAAKGDIGIGWTPVTHQVAQELDAYFSGKSADFKTPLAFDATDFTKDVWSELREIPAGETRSYSQIARKLGRPSAVRAVARANGANPIAILVPCHRVLGADGSLTGYGGGLWRKEQLIALERRYA